MIDLISSPLWFVFGLLAVIAAVYALRAVLGYRAVAADAVADYDYKAARNMIPKGLPKGKYIEIYKRVNNPRGSAYVAGGLGIILLTTPILFLALEWGLQLAYDLSGQNRVIEPGYLVWQFILFFVVVMFWASIAYAAARAYHRHTPGNLEFEIDRVIHGGEDIAVDTQSSPFENPPAIVLLGFFLGLVAVIYRVLSRQGYI